MLPLIIGAGFVIAVAALSALYVSQNIVQAPPDQAVILSGRSAVVVDPTSGEPKTVGHRVVSSGSAFRIPMIERMDLLPLGEMSIQVDADDLRDIEGYARSLSVLVNCRIAAENPSLDRALVRFLSMKLDDIEAIARATIESRINNTLLTADLSEESRWSEIESNLDAAVRDDLSQLGITVDTLIFSRIPVSSLLQQEVNGQGGGHHR